MARFEELQQLWQHQPERGFSRRDSAELTHAFRRYGRRNDLINIGKVLVLAFQLVFLVTQLRHRPMALFGACLNREAARFVDVLRAEVDFSASAKDLLRNAVLSFLNYIDTNRASWIVLYTQATSSQAFAHTVREGRERIVDLVARLLQSGTRHPEPDADFNMMAVALVGAGEAVANQVSIGDADVDEAAELMINLFWRGLRASPSEKDATAATAAGG